MTLVVSFDNLLSDTSGLLVASLRVAWEKFDGNAEGFPDTETYAILEKAVVIDNDVIRRCCRLCADHKTLAAPRDETAVTDDLSCKGKVATSQQEVLSQPLPIPAAELKTLTGPPTRNSAPTSRTDESLDAQPSFETLPAVEAPLNALKAHERCDPAAVEQAIYDSVVHLMSMCSSVIKPRPAALEWLVDHMMRSRTAFHGSSALTIAATGDVVRAQSAARAWTASIQASRSTEGTALDRNQQKVSGFGSLDLDDAVILLSSLRFVDWHELVEEDVSGGDASEKKKLRLREFVKEGPTCFVLNQAPASVGLPEDIVETYVALPELFPNGTVPRNKPPSKVSPMQRVLRHPITRVAWRTCVPVDIPITKGPVIHGFKRGSTALGVPTANMECEISFGTNHQCPLPGVYFGWCGVRHEKVLHLVFGCVVNVGYSPFYGNVHPSLEVHVFHEFGFDFYGAEVVLDIKALIRPEAKFPSFLELVDAIQADCEAADFLWHSVPVMDSSVDHSNLPYPPSRALLRTIQEWCVQKKAGIQSDSLPMVQVVDPDGNVKSTGHQNSAQ